MKSLFALITVISINAFASVPGPGVLVWLCKSGNSASVLTVNRSRVSNGNEVLILESVPGQALTKRVRAAGNLSQDGKSVRYDGQNLDTKEQFSLVIKIGAPAPNAYATYGAREVAHSLNCTRPGQQ